MKKLTVLFSILFSIGAAAQPQGNVIAYDCSGNSKDLYSTLASGKAVIIAHKGVDCGICINTAQVGKLGQQTT